jgi:hypothetical protein
MKRALSISMLLACLIVGCSSNPRFMTPMIAPVLNDAHLDIPIREVSAYTYWSVNFGHGLAVEVKAMRVSGEYVRDLELELSGAAKVLKALANSEFAGRWEFISVLFFNNYEQIPPGSRDVVGVVRVIVERDTLLMLFEKGAPSEEYQKHWVFIHGYKEQPDSEKLLEW